MRLGNHGADYLATVRYNIAREPTAQPSKKKNIIDFDNIFAPLPDGLIVFHINIFK
jgi:hypothetical protein